MKIDSGGEDDFEEMDDGVHENIGRFTCSMTVPDTFPELPKSINYWYFFFKLHIEIIVNTYDIILLVSGDHDSEDESIPNIFKKKYTSTISSKQESTSNTRPRNYFSTSPVLQTSINFWFLLLKQIY